MSASLALQVALRSRLVATPSITAVVPAANIFDRHERPSAPASINLGEAEERGDGDIDRRRSRIHHTVHVWQQTESLVGVTTLAGAIRAAVEQGGRLPLAEPFHCVGAWIASIRTVRDPGGWSHAIVVVEAIVEEVAL